MKFPVSFIVLLLVCAGALAADAAGTAVTFDTSDGVKISAVFVKGPAAKGPAVVLLPMLGRTKADWDPIISKCLLPETGFSFLAIDVRGHGSSTGQGDKTLNWKDFSARDFNDAVRDVEAAVKWLRARPDVDGDKIGIIGASIGANLALVYAASDPAIKVVALLSAAMDFRGVKIEQAMKDYGKRPVFIAASNEDGPAANSIRVLQKLSQADPVKGEGVGRLFDGNLRGTEMFFAQPLDRLLTDFLKKWLK